MSGNVERDGRGSALLLALIVSLVVAGLALSLVLTGSMESRIARNETVGAQALFAAESGARIVKGWFDRPGRALGFPFDSDVVVRERRILDEANPYGVGDSGGPEYKQGVDANGDGIDDLFAWPYRNGVVHALMGTPDSPDMLIENVEFLGRVSADAFGEFPDAGAGVQARIVQVAVFAPPYVKTFSGWVRNGMATIRVVAGIFRDRPGGRRETLSTRTVTMVLSEVPYGSAHGVIHSCSDLRLTGPLPAHWGTVFVTGNVQTVQGLDVAASLPRRIGENAESDPLWTDDPAWVTEFDAKIDPVQPIPDPWLRLVAGGSISAAPSPAAQPFAGPPPPLPGHPGPWSCCDASNIFQLQTIAECPRYDYELWKRIARSGEFGMRYFRFSPPAGFREDGVGRVITFGDVFEDANGEPGVYFFDTRDGAAPRDDDADGRFDNLTPELLASGDWSARGLVYVNAERITAVGLTGGIPTTMQAPAEPSVANDTAWIDLAYPANPFASFLPGGNGQWNSRGPAILVDAALHGVLHTNGVFEAGPGGLYYGSVIARGGITLGGTSVPRPGFFRDASLAGSWPPAEWDLPRTMVTSVLIRP